MISRIVTVLGAVCGASASLSQLSATVAEQVDANLSNLISEGIHMKSGEQVMVSFSGFTQTQYDQPSGDANFIIAGSS